MTVKSFLEANGSCTHFDINDGIMYNTMAAHSRYEKRMRQNASAEKDSRDISKRLHEDVRSESSDSKKVKFLLEKEVTIKKIGESCEV